MVLDLSGNYGSISVKNKEGSIYNNYSYDSVNKRLTISDVTDDIEIKFIEKFDASMQVAGGSNNVYVTVNLNNVCANCYPIDVDVYYKRSSDSSYVLYNESKISSGNGYSIGVDGLTDYTSYDIKVILTAANSYSVTLTGTAGTLCFTEGTKVLIEKGYKNIEDIQIGDYVYALDLDSNERILKKVIDKFEGYSDETYEIYVNDQKIVATPKHKFYVIDKGWISAYELKVGDKLSSLNNEKIEITKIKRVLHDEVVPVYNLTVEDLHTFLVSSEQILVHNYGSK